MELLFSRSVEYQFIGPVSVEEVIETLQANLLITTQLKHLLEDISTGLTIADIKLQIEHVELGSLKELFTIAIYALHQKELDQAIPKLVSKVTGLEVPPEQNTVFTLAFLLLLLYGGDFIQKYAIEKLDSSVLRTQVDVLISRLSQETGHTESQIMRSLEKHYSRKKTLIELGKAAVDFFRPSRSRSNEPILVDKEAIEPDVIRAIPKHINTNALENEDLTKELNGVQIEIRATDIDKDAQGWAGIVRTVSDQRKPIRLMPGVNREQLRTKTHVIGDVIVHYKDLDGTLKPTSFDLLRVDDGPA